MPALTPALRSEYTRLLASCSLTSRILAATRAGAALILAAEATYRAVERVTGVPWTVVGVIHQLESGGSFTRHLHNGDPLTARTTHVPAGRPLAGSPPFPWAESAVDALALKGLAAWRDWSAAGTLYELESYNGFGYRTKHGVPSPYLWSGTTRYTRGKYGADSAFDPALVSQQPGAVALFLALRELGADVAALRSVPSAGSASARGPLLALLAVGVFWMLTRD